MHEKNFSKDNGDAKETRDMENPAAQVKNKSIRKSRFTKKRDFLSVFR
jgi:hypothetical protein